MTARERWTVIIGGSVIAFTILLFRGGPAWFEWRVATAAERAELEREAARTEAYFDGLPLVVDSFEARAQRLVPQADNGFSGDGRTAARALATAATSSGTRHGIVVTSAVPVFDSVPEPAAVFVRARLQAVGDVRGLTDWLATLHSSRPLVRVEELRVRASDPFAPPDVAEQLLIDLGVVGVAIGQAPVPGIR